MKFPDKLDALTIHARLISETGGTEGLRDEGLLESALALPRLGITTKVPTL
jgi:prophage maintenance system killer protein